jgi:spore photoproduct lyase
LLDAQHNGRTRFRFSLNSRYVIKHFEPGVWSALDGGGEGWQGKLSARVYPRAVDDRWRLEYAELMERLSKELVPEANLTFELIQHRFTAVSKKTILTHYPATKLGLDESKRKYGRGKAGWRCHAGEV